MPPFTESDWAALQDRVGTLETGVRILAAGQVQLTEQLAEITVAQHRAEEQRRAQGERMDLLAGEVRANTELTERTLAAAEAVRDVVITARTGGRFVRWLTPTLVALGAALLAVKGAWVAGVEWLFPPRP